MPPRGRGRGAQGGRGGPPRRGGAAVARPRAAAAAAARVGTADDSDDSDVGDGAHVQNARMLGARVAPSPAAPMRGACIVTCLCSGAVNVEAHPIGIILHSLKSLNGVRFSLSRDHWKGRPSVHRSLPENVIGCAARWLGAKAANKVHVAWESDASNSDEHLDVHAALTLALEP